MVRKPARKAARSSSATKPAAPVGAGFAEIAKEARVSLGQLRGEFASTVAIFAAHIKAIDRAVLAEDLSDMAEEPPRERLFDVLMRRLEILAPHRQAVRSLLRSARRNPPLALALNGLAVRSQQWMLTAAAINASGPRGCSARCWAPGCVTTIPGLPAPWRRSTARWPAASAFPASSTICVTSRRGCAGCGRAGAGGMTMPRKSRPWPDRARRFTKDYLRAASTAEAWNAFKQRFFIASLNWLR
jgi:AcrR family transcriptional regulator